MSGTVFPTPTINWGTSLQDPTAPTQIATKEYVDAKVGGIPEAPTDGQTYGRDGQTAAWNPITLAPVASSTAPLMDGTAAAGVATAWSRGDHVHPTDTSRYAATNPSAYVNAAGAAAAAPVQSVATRTGAVTLTHSDITDWATTLTPYALLASPTFTGTPSLPTGTTGVTQTTGTNNTTLATTAFVQSSVAVPGSATPLMDGTAAVGTSLLYARQDHIHPTDTSRAPLGSPALTGTPTAPTAVLGTNTTQIATTAFVQAAIPAVAPATVSPLMDGLAAVGTSLLYARQDHVHPSDTSRAPLASPGLTGAPTAPTPATADNSTAIATTAFVKAQGYGAPVSPATVAPLMDGTAAVGTSPLYARQDHVHPTDTSRAPLASPTFTGTVTIPAGAAIAGYAPLLSPALTGIPTAPTPASTDNSTTLATTAYVKSVTGAYLPLTGGTVSAAASPGLTLSTTGIDCLMEYVIGGNYAWEIGVRNSGSSFVVHDAIGNADFITCAPGGPTTINSAVTLGGSVTVSSGSINVTSGSVTGNAAFNSIAAAWPGYNMTIPSGKQWFLGVASAGDCYLIDQTDTGWQAIHATAGNPGTITFGGPTTISGATTINGTTTLNGATSSLSGGLNFGNQIASAVNDLTKHIQINSGGTYGINATSGAMGLCVASGGALNVYNGTTLVLSINNATVNALELLKGAGFGNSISTQTASAYTVGATDHSLILNPSATMTLTMPAATGVNVGRIFKLKLISAFAVNSASANIVPLVGGAATTAIMTATAGKFCMLQSDGTNWQIMEAN